MSDQHTSETRLQNLEQEIKQLKKFQEDEKKSDQVVKWVFVGVVIIFFILGIVGFLISKKRLDILSETPQIETSTIDKEESAIILTNAQQAVETGQIILDFLSGTSVLVTVGLGAAAVFGVQQFRNYRQEINAEMRDLRIIKTTIQENLFTIENQLQQIQQLKDDVNKEFLQLDALSASLNEQSVSLDEQRTNFNNDIQHQLDDMSSLVIAAQEVSLENYDEAYQFAKDILDREKKRGKKDSSLNPMALYIAGWLEIDHYKGSIDSSIEHLHILHMQKPNWMSAKAAYGVALRRYANQLKGETKTAQLYEALSHLTKALNTNPLLTDLKQESYWGPVGGIHREMNNVKEGIKAYKRALDITPESSYPQGNLAALLLCKAKREQDNIEDADKNAEEAFIKTIAFAKGELRIKPTEYYVLMDKAMAQTVLGRQDKADKSIQKALQFASNTSTLRVSLRGWVDLWNFLPTRKRWTHIKPNLEKQIKIVLDQIKRKVEDEDKDKELEDIKKNILPKDLHHLLELDES